MIDVLDNNLNIINNIVKNIKDFISFYAYPAMFRRIESYHKNTNNFDFQNNSNKNNKKEKKEIDKKEHLSLDNIMVIEVDGEFMITMMGLRQDNCEERVLLTKRKTQNQIIEKCLNDNLSFSVRNIKEFISDDAVDVYNRAVDAKEFQACLEVLELLEKKLNANSCKEDNVKKKVLS